MSWLLTQVKRLKAIDEIIRPASLLAVGDAMSIAGKALVLFAVSGRSENTNLQLLETQTLTGRIEITRRCNWLRTG
jgi:hypothetical protein